MLIPVSLFVGGGVGRGNGKRAHILNNFSCLQYFEGLFQKQKAEYKILIQEYSQRKYLNSTESYSQHQKSLELSPPYPHTSPMSLSSLTFNSPSLTKSSSDLYLNPIFSSTPDLNVTHSYLRRDSLPIPTVTSPVDGPLLTNSFLNDSPELNLSSSSSSSSASSSSLPSISAHLSLLSPGIRLPESSLENALCLNGSPGSGSGNGFDFSFDQRRQ